MTDKVKLVQGDFGHKLSVTLTNASTGAVIDVSSATVRLFFRKAGAATLTSTVVGTFPSGGADGKVDFTWPSSSLLAAGEYEGEVEIDGVTKKQTVYDKLKFKVRQQLEV
jgi:hypothetical protein